MCDKIDSLIHLRPLSVRNPRQFRAAHLTTIFRRPAPSTSPEDARATLRLAVFFPLARRSAEGTPYGVKRILLLGNNANIHRSNCTTLSLPLRFVGGK